MSRTLQEALIAQRIIHFAKERLFFECSALDCFEGGDISQHPNDHKSPDLLNHLYGGKRSLNFLRQQVTVRSVDDELVDWEEMGQRYKDYYSAVQSYSMRKLTFLADRALALSAIIKAVSRITGSKARHGVRHTERPSMESHSSCPE